MSKLKKRILIFILALVFSFALFGCNNSKEPTKEGYIADNTEHYDDITKTLKLTKSYEGKSFLTDGIGSATVDAYTDGDTTRFLLAQGDVIVIRYYHIDTPESTSNVEKWGKAASTFTKKALQSATEIVLEATESRAVHDSYGTRYLGYVWYKTEGSDFKCLNLELVENGYTENKGINTSDYPYYSYFDKANKFAKSIKLRLYSDLDDPLYSTEPVDMSLKEFYDNTDLYWNEDTESGAKVRLVAYLESLYISNSGTYTYTAKQVDPETGKTLKINVYAGYVSSPASKMKLGHLYEIFGNVQNYYDNFQISGVLYDTIYEGQKGYTTVIQKDYYLTFDSSINFITQNGTTLYSDVTVTESNLEGTTLTIVGTAKQNSINGYKEDNFTYTFKVEVPNGFNNDFTAGTKFSVSAYQLEAKSGILKIFNYSDIVRK